MTRFLMTDPRHFNVSYRINPWMEPDAWDADAARAAQSGSAALRKAIEAAGGVVETVPAVEGLPDLVFPANAAIVLDGRVLLARFRHPQRQGEEAVFRAAFEGLQRRKLVEEIVELPDGVLQEGAGDCIWDADRGFFWVGHGQRSTASSQAVIADVFGQETVALELAGPRFYHLDTCFCPLAGGKLLYYPPAFTAASLAAIHAHVAPEDRIAAGDAEAAAFCVNAVNIARQVIMARAPESLERKLAAHGYAVRPVDLAPFILSGGGAYCMTLRLDRRSGAQALRTAAE
jgi:N-dimethylarginine dimethylaminohydrolase